jgi:hypothetical protein
VAQVILSALAVAALPTLLLARMCARGHPPFVRSAPQRRPARAIEGRQPLVIFAEGSGFGPAWQVFVYDDGTVIDYRSDRDPPRLEGVLGRDAARSLAERLGASVGRPELRRESQSEDGPWCALSVRVGGTWTTDRAAGMFHGGVLTNSPLGGTGVEERPWSRLFDAVTQVTTLKLEQVHPWIPPSIDLCLYPADRAAGADPWPETLPLPPSLADLERRSPPCYSVAGSYAEAATHRVTSPGTWAVAIEGHVLQLTTVVHLPGEEILDDLAPR